ncbi:MAG: hypothetical protein M3O26_06130 [Pseudomonadota bacterium]|nr:hypothetical protein [Pseudomonadota bacterium]
MELESRRDLSITSIAFPPDESFETVNTSLQCDRLVIGSPDFPHTVDTVPIIVLTTLPVVSIEISFVRKLSVATMNVVKDTRRPRVGGIADAARRLPDPTRMPSLSATKISFTNATRRPEADINFINKNGNKPIAFHGYYSAGYMAHQSRVAAAALLSNLFYKHPWQLGTESNTQHVRSSELSDYVGSAAQLPDLKAMNPGELLWRRSNGPVSHGSPLRLGRYRLDPQLADVRGNPSLSGYFSKLPL